jgi:hypothetical protein
MLRCCRWRRASHGDRLLEKRERLWLGGDTQVDAQNFAQVLKLSNGGLSVATTEMTTHEGTACLLVGSIDLEDVLPAAGRTKVLEPARPQSLAVRLNPFAVRILRQKVCRFGFRMVCVDLQPPGGPQCDELALCRDRFLPAKRPPAVVNGLSKIRGCMLRRQVRPESFHDLLSVQAALRLQGEELDKVGSSPVTPGFRGHRSPIDLHPKATQKPHDAGPRHRQFGR